MAIQNLSTQYISASFQNLMQVSASGDVYNGAGTQVSALNVTSTYATTAGSAAAITGLDTSIFATTGSNIFTSNQTIQGNVIITGNLTANQYVVSSSVYVVTQSFSSGSTIFGNDSLDTHKCIRCGNSNFINRIAIRKCLDINVCNFCVICINCILRCKCRRKFSVSIICSDCVCMHWICTRIVFCIFNRFKFKFNVNSFIR